MIYSLFLDIYNLVLALSQSSTENCAKNNLEKKIYHVRTYFCTSIESKCLKQTKYLPIWLLKELGKKS